MVEIELGGLLEEKLRRLVELGFYTSLSEAVRDAVRRLLREIDLMKIALKLYLDSDASFQYVTYYAEASFEEMIEYMLQHGYTPLLGLHKLDEKTVESIVNQREYVLDPITIYVVYKTNLLDIMSTLRRQGYRFYAPASIKTWSELLEARRIPFLLEERRVLEYFSVGKIRGSTRKTRLTLHEIYSIEYAKENNAVLLSEDIRTREHASREGVVSTSIVFLIYLSKEFINKERVLSALQELKTIPVIVPDNIVEELLG